MLAPGIGDREAGWFLRHAPDRALVDQSVQRIGQGTVVQAGSRGPFQILERNTGGPVLGGLAAQSLQHSHTLKRVGS